MEYIGLLAPIAFVFALAALNYTFSLKKDIKQLSDDIERLKQ